MSRFNTISFLSDFGTRDEYVGLVKSVIHTISPQVTVIDITHEIEPYDVRAAGLTLARSAQYLPPGVVLAVVDPGVGTERKPIVIEVGDGQSYLVGPDNGIFAPAVSLVGGATAAAVLDNPEYQLSSIGTTFDGRDRFGPAAAHLCNGVPIEEIGTPIDPSKLLPSVLSVSSADGDGVISAEVLWVDRFGNVQLNVDPGEIADWPAAVRVVSDEANRTAQKVESFGDISTGAIGVMTDSYGLLALCVDRGSAASDLRLTEGDAVSIEPADNPRNATPVDLLTKPVATRDEL